MRRKNQTDAAKGAWLLALLMATCAAPGRAEPFALFDPGTEQVVDFKKYGRFINPGTPEFTFQILDKGGLARALGEGIDPNVSLRRDPLFVQFKRQGKLAGSQWDHVNTSDPQADFYVWASAKDEDPGVRLLFTGRALEAAGHYHHALKAYHAALVLYPRSFGWAADQSFTWPVATAARDAMVDLLRAHPELGMKLTDSVVQTEMMIGGDLRNNRITVAPGRLVKISAQPTVDVATLKTVKRRGGRVACVKYENGQWGLEVDGKPFVVRGISYTPTKVGKHINDWNWMFSDENGNGLNDPAYESWVDKNKNNRQDPDERAVGDFALLRTMGVNAVRVMNSDKLNIPLLRELYNKFGIRVVLCEPLGAYTLHSGATWQEGTDYTDAAQKKRMLDALRALVKTAKDEPWLLMYVLGNENNMPANTNVNATRTNAASHPQAYAEFLNEAAALVHKMDPEHPVGVGNWESTLVDVYARHAQELDFLGINSYKGGNGFGSLWMQAKATFDRPVLITEYGCDAYAANKGPDEAAQEKYHRACWKDIDFNRAGQGGEGNAIGGMVFEWLDEWWKDTNRENDAHDHEATTAMNMPDGWAHEEWYGVAGQGNGKNSPFLRQLRQVYNAYVDIWGRNKAPAPAPSTTPAQEPRPAPEQKAPPAKRGAPGKRQSMDLLTPRPAARSAAAASRVR